MMGAPLLCYWAEAEGVYCAFLCNERGKYFGFPCLLLVACSKLLVADEPLVDEDAGDEHAEPVRALVG